MADERHKPDADRKAGGVVGGYASTDTIGATSPTIIVLRVNSTTGRLLVDSNAADITSIIPGVGATNLGKAEDAVHASGDTGVMALGVRNDNLLALAADGDYHPLTVDSHAGLHTSPEHSIILDELEVTTGWTALSTDTTGVTTNADHISGTASVEFDKVNGDANTVFAGVQKTITATDLSLFHIHESIHIAINLSTIANVDYVFVRLGTDSSNYNEWRIQDDDLAAGWQVLKMTIGNASTAGSTGDGWNPAVVTYAVVGVAFDAETNTLANIRVNHLSLHSGLHTTSDITSEVTTAVNSPNIRLVDYGGSVSTDAGNAGSGTLRVVLATDQPAVTVDLGTDNDVSLNAGTNVVGKVRLVTASGDEITEDTDDSMQVTIVADDVGIGGGTQYAVDAALGTTPTGTVAIAKRDDTLTALTPVEGDAVELRVDANGALWINLATKLDNVNDSILIYANTVKDGSGTDYVPLVDADGNLQVDVLSVPTITVNSHAVTNAGTFAVQSTNDSLIGPGDPVIDSYAHIAINLAAAANQVLVSSAASKQIWVYGFALTCSVAGTVSFQDEDDTAITGIMDFEANSGMAVPPSGNFAMPIWKLATDKDLEVDVVTAAIDGWLDYAIVSV